MFQESTERRKGLAEIADRGGVAESVRLHFDEHELNRHRVLIDARIREIIRDLAAVNRHSCTPRPPVDADKRISNDGINRQQDGVVRGPTLAAAGSRQEHCRADGAVTGYAEMADLSVLC